MSPTVANVERAISHRINTRIAIFDGPYQKRLLLNYSVNLSDGGVFIETADLLPVDTMFAVKFKLPGFDSIISCQARVAWTNEPALPKKPNLPSGMGLSFLDLSLKDMHAIRSHISRGGLVPTW